MSVILRRSKVSGNYASGIDNPIRADGDGGFALTEGDSYIRSQVLACVSPNESDNPFQDLGGDELAVFQNADDIRWRTQVKRRIKRQFQFLEDENLARLQKITFERGDAEGDFRVVISYLNLESTTNNTVSAELLTPNTQGVRVQVGG